MRASILKQNRYLIASVEGSMTDTDGTPRRRPIMSSATSPVAAVGTDLVVPVKAEVDVLLVRQEARRLASGLRFSSAELTLIVMTLARPLCEVARSTTGPGSMYWLTLDSGRAFFACGAPGARRSELPSCLIDIWPVRIDRGQAINAARTLCWIFACMAAGKILARPFAAKPLSRTDRGRCRVLLKTGAAE